MILYESLPPLPNKQIGRIPISINASNLILSFLPQNQVKKALQLSNNQKLFAQKIETLTFSQEQSLFKHILQVSQRTELGLLIGQKMHTAYYGMLGYLMLVSPNLSTALQCAFRFPLQLGCYFQTRLRIEDEWAFLEIDAYAHEPSLYGFQVDFCLSAYHCIIQNLLGPQFKLTALLLKQDSNPHQNLYANIFGVAPQFNQTSDALCFPKKWLTVETLYSSPMAYDIALEHCKKVEQDLIFSIENPIVMKLIHLMRQDIAQYSSEKNVAQALYMTERTLRRHLKNAGTRFQSTLDQVRMEMACAYLKNSTLSINQIAEKLAYSDISAFRNAFKRCNNCSPSHYRNMS